MKWRALIILAVAETLAMALWFGVSAVAPKVAAEWSLTASATAWLTLSVQLGFVAGTLASAIFNLPDVISARRLFAICAFTGALVNAWLALYSHSAASAIPLRFITGACLAGVYPPGMKLVATWFKTGRGFALGTLIAALTIGKAMPYLVNAFALRWRTNVLAMSVCAAAAAVLVIALKPGPYALPNQPFDITQVANVFRNRGVRLASFGYFGHMWELYAVWTWAPAMLRAALSARAAEIASFILIGSGAIGCMGAGLLADKYGRSEVASAAMAISGACCIAIGFLFHAPAPVLLILIAIWGVSVVADSAQFSACITEYGDARYLGTALTLQTSIGFLITTVSIWMMPRLVDLVGWRYAFIALAPGPFLGILAMMRLRATTPTTSSPQPAPLPASAP